MAERLRNDLESYMWTLFSGSGERYLFQKESDDKRRTVEMCADLHVSVSFCIWCVSLCSPSKVIILSRFAKQI